LLSPNDLFDLLSAEGTTNTNRALLCLAVKPAAAIPLQDIRKTGVAAGWAKAKTANLSSYLAQAKGLVVSTPDGWQLTTSGKNHVAGLVATSTQGTVAPKTAAGLRAHVTKLANADTRAFVEEAVRCFEGKLYRSAVVLSWIGALALLYDFVVAKKLKEFNAEALKRDAKWKAASNNDGLARMGEHDFLQILPAIGVIGKNVKDELEICLKLRNGCGHPNSMKIAEHRVAAHIEQLMLNVFDVF
jgi:hypothetical protein